MPTYNYKCENCKEIYSVIQSIKDDPLTTCQNCGGKIQRVISGGMGLIFKGSGFYITDYAKSDAMKSGETIKKNKSAEGTETNSTKETSSAETSDKKSAEKSSDK